MVLLWFYGAGPGGEAAPELLGRPAAKDAGGRRGVGGPEGEDGRGGGVLEIAHVGGGPLLVGFRATHGDEDRARGGGRRAALLEQKAEVGGQRGIGRRRGAAPGIELTQRAAVGRAGVGAQGVRGEASGGRRGDGQRPRRVGAAGERGRVGRCGVKHNGHYQSQ